MDTAPSIFDSNEYFNVSFESLKLWEENLIDYSFEDCSFHSCQFEKVSFSCSIFTSCEFINCSFLMCDIGHTTLNGAHFNDSRIIGLNFSECNSFAFSPYFYKCILDSNIFFNNDFVKGKFIECKIKDIDFIECNFKSASFAKSSFSAVIFSKCDLEKADFLGAKDYSVDPFNNNLKNAKFDLPEAQSFLSFLDIKIVDD